MKPLTSHSLSSLVFTVLVIFLSSFAFNAAGAAENTPDTNKTGSDLHVISDEMVAEQGKRMVEFIGNVKATHGDSTLLADSVKVFFHDSGTRSKKAEAPQGNLRQIIAAGNVDYTAGDRRALADKAVYTAETEVLVLTGTSPKLLTGKSWVTGKKITLFRNQERVMVESDGKSRVQAFFDSEDQNRPTDNSKP